MSKKFHAFAACLSVAGAVIAQPAQIEVKDAWARATAGNAENGAAYVTIESPTADKITSPPSSAYMIRSHQQQLSPGVESGGTIHALCRGSAAREPSGWSKVSYPAS